MTTLCWNLVSGLKTMWFPSLFLHRKITFSAQLLLQPFHTAYGSVSLDSSSGIMNGPHNIKTQGWHWCPPLVYQFREVLLAKECNSGPEQWWTTQSLKTPSMKEWISPFWSRQTQGVCKWWYCPEKEPRVLVWIMSLSCVDPHPHSWCFHRTEGGGQCGYLG